MALVLLLLVLTATPHQIRAQGSGLPAVATYSILADIVQQVGGDRISLTRLVGPDGDAHMYEPTPGDTRSLNAAAVVFENGLGFEPWLDRLYASSGSRARRVVVSEGIQPLTRETGGRTETDPHIWHDVALASQMTMAVRDGLTQADPANAEIYAANAGAYLAQLQELDAWVIEQVGAIPAGQRVLVTSHDTFGYFARRYGFQILGSVLPTTTDAQPSAAQMAALAREIRAVGVPAVFPENVATARLLERVASEARVGVAPLLYSDALGGPETAGSTYVRMVQYNVATIVSALRGWR
jgi:ABC-type Zn uptake system ZnuABC Zn-binding protein ZnuA